MNKPEALQHVEAQQSLGVGASNPEGAGREFIVPKDRANLLLPQQKDHCVGSETQEGQKSEAHQTHIKGAVIPQTATCSASRGPPGGGGGGGGCIPCGCMWQLWAALFNVRETICADVSFTLETTVKVCCCSLDAVGPADYGQRTI